MNVPTMHCMVGIDDTVLPMLRRGTLEYCVLALLSTGATYGFDLSRRLAEDGVLMSSEGTLYPLLGRLRDRGAVETSWEPSQSGPPRRYYQITPSGRVALEDFRERWGEFSARVNECLSGRIS